MSLTILTPLRTEAAAVRLGLRGTAGVRVVRTGAGADRARSAAPSMSGAEVVAGVCGALVPELHAGDLVVAGRLLDAAGTEVGVDDRTAASLLAALVDAGLPARIGCVASTERLVRGGDARRALARTGAIAVDLESAPLVASRPEATVVRAVVDSPEAELLSPATVTGGLRALAALRRAAPIVARWAATQPIATVNT